MREFYLTSSDGRELNQHPRYCTLVNVVTMVSVDDEREAWLVRATPPLPGASYGQDIQDLSLLLLTTRFLGDTLPDSTVTLPVHVYVCRPLKEAFAEVARFTPDDYVLLEWGEIHATEASALSRRLD